MKPVLTLDEARQLDFGDLVARVEDMLAQYDKPDVEQQDQRIARLNQILDEMPVVYRWFLQLRSWYDHWTQGLSETWGRNDHRVRALRQRRDFFDNMASAAKMRYEGASRQITVEMEFDPSGLPRSRKGN